MNAGVVLRVDGPLVEVDHPGRLAMHELVELGPAALPGEVVAIRDGRATVQAYEYTGGLRPADPVRATGGPLTAPLGPGLLGGVFDGLLRPLSDGPVWLLPRAPGAGTDDRRWSFEPLVTAGSHADVGSVLGTVPGPGPVGYRILVPPGVTGPVDRIAPVGRYAVTDEIAVIDGTPVRLSASWPVRHPRPVRERLPARIPLHTGQRVIDLLFPILKGSTVAVPGGFGTGKTMLLQQIAKWCDADVIVYVGCGERGNEMADVVADLLALTDPRGGGRLADRSVVIANTSNMPMMARESGVHSAVTVAEYFRDMGYDVLVIADSTSRWAEALREFASRTGALPAEEGYPATLGSALAAFYERAGAAECLGGATGSVTIVGAVSPPGGDLTEPVTAHSQRFVRGLWTLDRDLAYARHYPAVSCSGSFSRDAEAVATWHARDGAADWAGNRARVLGLLAESDRLNALADLIGIAGLAAPERVTLLTARLMRDAVLRQNALSPQDAHCGPTKGAALVEAVLAVGDRLRALAAAGHTADELEAIDFGPLVRVRDLAGPDDAELVGRARDTVLAGWEAAS
ncbi:V-type ATP synthase subunit A [Actinoplanes sp. KI2]|uniref:V-type ATP synthase subunit A n=1 Tax=Actinoplanes sp. KI2 TaxID=2983315 RepID=UPI0021D58683|nr:V-type ATP synthase subunit A [Actinoplanes sp. KI2]MCU7729429.1 V-type ATP synthase subunit A [Actinoplanes sp. KI2]